MTMSAVLRLALATGVLVAASLSLSLAQGVLNETKPGIWGEALDAEGNPVPDLPIRLKRNVEGDPGFVVKTTKKGAFVFPQVELFEAGFILTIDDPEWYIRKYQIRARRGTREIYQDDTGQLNPKAQDQLPVVRHRGANTTISLEVARVADYKAPAAAPGAPGAPPPARELTLAEKADEAAALGDYATAVDLLGQALAAAPDDVELLWARARYLAKSGDTPGAIREGSRVIQLQPERKGARLEMAAWMSDRGQLTAAIPLLEKERELDPQSTVVAKGLVGAYGEAGQADKLEAEVARWLSIAPDDPEALLAQADLLARKGDYEAAEQIFRKLAASDPANADRMYYNAGVSIMNKHGVTNDDRKRAITAFEKSVEVNPKYAKAYNQLGLAYLGLGDYAKAREAFKKFVELEPSGPDADAAKDMLKALPAK